MTEFTKEDTVGYITLITLSIIEACVYIFAGIKLLGVTSWMSVIPGILMILMGVLSLIGGYAMVKDKDEAKEYVDDLAENKTIEEWIEKEDAE